MLTAKENGLQMTLPNLNNKVNGSYEGPLDSNRVPIGFEPLDEPEFGPLRSGYAGIDQEIKEDISETEQDSNAYTGPVDDNGIPVGFEKVEDIPEVKEPVTKSMGPLYYRGAPLPPEVAKGAAEDLEAFGKDVPRIFAKTTKNITTMALNSFLPSTIRDSINSLPEKQRNKALNKLTEKALSYAMPFLGSIDWDNPETIDPETQRIRGYDSDAAIVVDMGLLLTTGNKVGAATGIAKAGIKNFPKLSGAVEEIVGFGTAGLIFLDPDVRIGNVIKDAIVDPEDPDSEYLGKSVVDFMSANPDDTMAEKQLKIAVETASLTAVVRGFITAVPPVYRATKQALSATAKQADKVLTKPRQFVFGKRPEEMTKAEADEAFIKYVKEQRELDSIRNINTLEETEAGVRQIKAQSLEGKNLKGKAGAVLYQVKQRVFTSRGLKTPLMYEALQSAKYNQKQFITAAQDIANRMNNAYKATNGNKKLIEKTDNLIETDLSDIFKMSKSKQAPFLAKREGISEDLASEILMARQTIDEVSTKILNTSGFTDEAYAAIQNDLGTYLRTSYRIFTDAGFSVDAQLKETVRASMSRANVQKVISKADDAGNTLSAKRMDTIVKNADEKARVELDEILTDTGFTADYVAQATRVGRFFKKNKNLSADMKKLLGEIKDPGERIILSIQNASRIVEMQNFYNTTLKLGNGKYIFNKGTKGQMSIGVNGKPKYPTQITGTNSVLDNMYTTPQIAEALANKEATFAIVEADNIMSEAYRYYVGYKGFAQSMKTVYSLSTQARNVLGASQMAGANGVVFKQADELTSKVIANRLSKAKNSREERLVYDEMYQEYQGLGIINTQTTFNQYREMMEGGIESFAKRRKQLKEITSDIPLVGKAVQKIDKAVDNVGGSSAGNLVFRKPAEVYTATDDFAKIRVYETELDVLKRAFPNADEELLKRQAASSVKNNMPNYDRVPPSLKALGKTPIGNFIAFPAEIVRTSGHILKQSFQEIRSSNSVIRKRGLERFIGFAVANVGYYGIAKGSQMILGMSDQEVEDRKLLSSGPWSAGHDMIFNRDSDTGKMYGLNTQYLNSYYTIQAPFRTALDTYEDGLLKGNKWDTIAADVITDALVEITEPYITESIATGPIRSLVTGWLNETGKDSEGMQVRDDKSGILWENIIGKLYESFEPGFMTKTESMMDAINKVPSDYDQSYRDPYYETFNQIGFNWSEQDLERDTTGHIRNFKILKKKNLLDYVKFSTTVEDIHEDIIKTNSIEFQHQQDLHVYIKAARRQLDDPRVLKLLREEGYTVDSAQKMLLGQFVPKKITKDLTDKHTKEILRLSDTDSINFQNRLDEMESVANDLFESMNMLPLDKPYETFKDTYRTFQDFEKANFDSSFLESNPPLTPEEREEAGLMKKATGGEVSTPVPNAPIEPDERINKLTGLPYNEGAGTAYMDQDDPMRRMNMAAGGKVLNKLKGNCN